MSVLCKLNFPLYCCQALDASTCLVSGGGGAAKTGVPNIVVSSLLRILCSIVNLVLVFQMH